MKVENEIETVVVTSTTELAEYDPQMRSPSLDLCEMAEVVASAMAEGIQVFFQGSDFPETSVRIAKKKATEPRGQKPTVKMAVIGQIYVEKTYVFSKGLWSLYFAVESNDDRTRYWSLEEEERLHRDLAQKTEKALSFLRPPEVPEPGSSVRKSRHRPSRH